MGRRHKIVAKNTSIEIRQRDVMALRCEGWSIRDIAERVGVCKSQVKRDLDAALAEVAEERKERANYAMDLELARLDGLAVEAQDVLADDESDGSVRLQAITTLLKVSERRAKLLGLDAATKNTIVVSANPLESLTPEQLEHVRQTGELPEGVTIPALGMGAKA
jgi:hypothetical protein